MPYFVHCNPDGIKGGVRVGQGKGEEAFREALVAGLVATTTFGGCRWKEMSR